MMKDEVQAIEEESDPVDKYKHVAVVDCSKAFSNQEVSQISRELKVPRIPLFFFQTHKIILTLSIRFCFVVRTHFRQAKKHNVFECCESDSVQI